MYAAVVYCVNKIGIGHIGGLIRNLRCEFTAFCLELFLGLD